MCCLKEYYLVSKYSINIFKYIYFYCPSICPILENVLHELKKDMYILMLMVGMFHKCQLKFVDQYCYSCFCIFADFLFFQLLKEGY